LDVSVADGISIFNDNRAKRIDYTPSAYPYTIVFNLETVSTNTAFLPQWYPIEGYHLSTEQSSVKIINNSEIQLSYKETNLDSFKIEKKSEFYYEAKNIPAINYEAYSPSFTETVPYVKFALKQFSMESVEGENTDWSEFGKWINDKLIAGTQELPETVKLEILNLTADAKTPLEKAKIVYNYMQNKTRYISVQIGIGGWKPMLASDVDRLGYGDCKGLSNYTKALLDVVGVQSYYTIVYGDSDIRDIDTSFSSLQGNHAILSIPDNNSYITLECTDQTVPFGYNANFTDDRDVLIVTPTGGQIVHTKAYETNDNSQVTHATVNLDNSGSIIAEINIKSKGTQYSKYR
ncbi:MAG: transglutaminase family protein, partial [Candidatus Marinimicrobia bacterium]|nr:transglutaminase family protein [Candidatus Neomarinimicrobiota bacterium]